MFLLSVALGVASQIHYQPIELPELVSASPTIVVVEDADPPTRPISLPAGSVSMETNLMRLRVISVVRAPEGQVSPEQIIEIGAANLSEQRMMVQRYHDHGLSISPIFQSYEGPGVEGRRVMFLRPCGVGDEPGLCMTVTGGVESVERLGEIQALLVEPPAD
jgi:hypothetical protein